MRAYSKILKIMEKKHLKRNNLQVSKYIRMNEINIKSNKSKQNSILKDRLLKTKKENSKSAAIELLLQLSFF